MFLKWSPSIEAVLAAAGLFFVANAASLLAQDPKPRDEHSASQLAEREQLTTIRRLIGQLDSRDRRERFEARDKLLEIRDPNAVKAIAHYLRPERSKEDGLRRFLVEVLANIPSSAAAELMIDTSLSDPAADVRREALWSLAVRKEAAAVPSFLKRLADQSNRQMVNRAAYALGYMNDPIAVGALIDALVPRSTLTNHPVLDSLRTLTGKNFDYNVEQWRAWHAAEMRWVKRHTITVVRATMLISARIMPFGRIAAP